eukprot:6627112-Pyramimonas_sp.AAC.1
MDRCQLIISTGAKDTSNTKVRSEFTMGRLENTISSDPSFRVSMLPSDWSSVNSVYKLSSVSMLDNAVAVFME